MAGRGVGDGAAAVSRRSSVAVAVGLWAAACRSAVVWANTSAGGVPMRTRAPITARSWAMSPTAVMPWPATSPMMSA